MNQPNPDISPSEDSANTIDPKLLRAVAVRLAAARKNPPTVVGSLLKWPGTPMLILIGGIGTAILFVLGASPRSPITLHWPLGLGAMTFGAALRDLGLARRVKRIWEPQSHFIDWQKVDDFTP